MLALFFLFVVIPKASPSFSRYSNSNDVCFWFPIGSSIHRINDHDLQKNMSAIELLGHGPALITWAVVNQLVIILRKKS